MLKKTGIVLALLVLFIQQGSAQTLRFEITGYDAQPAGYYTGFSGICIMPMHIDANGVRQGNARIYSLNNEKQDKLLFAGTWKDGLLVDTAYWYFNDGQLKRRAILTDNRALAAVLPWPDAKNLGPGTLQGETTTWNRSQTGTYISMVENFAGGKRSGMVYSYSGEGKLNYQEEYRNGVRNGNYTSYYTNGQINGEGAFENNKREGVWNFYYPTGVLSQTAIYRNDRLEDSVVYFHKNGKRKTVSMFLHGRMAGDHLEYDTLGRITYYSHYGADSWRDSVEINYYPDGRIKNRCQMAHDDRNGAFMAWHENGKPAESGLYRNNNRTGIWMFYDTRGKLIRKHDYDKYPDEPVEMIDGVGEEIAEIVDYGYSEIISPPVFKAFRTAVVLPEKKPIRFPRKLKFIDLDARVERDGKVSYTVVSVLPEKEKQQLLDWLKANYSRAEPFSYNGRTHTCNTHFRVYITKK